MVVVEDAWRSPLTTSGAVGGRRHDVVGFQFSNSVVSVCSPVFFIGFQPMFGPTSSVGMVSSSLLVGAHF